MRVLSANLWQDRDEHAFDKISTFVTTESIDVVCLQENVATAYKLAKKLKWQCVQNQDKNLAILSRFDIVAVEKNTSFLTADINNTLFCCCHMTDAPYWPYVAREIKYGKKIASLEHYMEESVHARALPLLKYLIRHRPDVICGDFNEDGTDGCHQTLSMLEYISNCKKECLTYPTSFIDKGLPRDVKSQIDRLYVLRKKLNTKTIVVRDLFLRSDHFPILSSISPNKIKKK